MLGLSAEEWFRIAETYHLSGLKVLAENAIGGNLDVENALEAFRLSSVYNTPTLKITALKFIKL